MKGSFMHTNMTRTKISVSYIIVTVNLSMNIKPKEPILFPNNQFSNKQFDFYQIKEDYFFINLLFSEKKN